MSRSSPEGKQMVLMEHCKQEICVDVSFSLVWQARFMIYTKLATEIDKCHIIGSLLKSKFNMIKIMKMTVPDCNRCKWVAF